MQTNSNSNNAKPNDNANKNPQAGSTIKDAPPQTETALDAPKDGQVQKPGQQAGNDATVSKDTTVGQAHDKSAMTDKCDDTTGKDSQVKSQDNARK